MKIYKSRKHPQAEFLTFLDALYASNYDSSYVYIKGDTASSDTEKTSNAAKDAPIVKGKKTKTVNVEMTLEELEDLQDGVAKDKTIEALKEDFEDLKDE